MTFTLQPGDWIPTSEVPSDKQQAVIDAFVAAGAAILYGSDGYKSFDYDYVGWWTYTNTLSGSGLDSFHGFDREVTLEQILGEQIAENANCFEPRKPGDYETIEQMEREAEHWQRVGPELLDALDDIIKSSDLGNAAILNKLVVKAQKAITKARSIK